MNRKWLLFEKIYAVLIILLGFLSLYQFYLFWKMLWDSRQATTELFYGGIGISAQADLLTVGMLIAAGILLMLNKKSGWLINISLLVCSIGYGVVQIFSKHRFISIAPNYLLPVVFFLLVCIITTILFLQKPMLTKYLINKRDILVVFCLILVISVDVLYNCTPASRFVF
ncbi:hypothetical protein ACFGVR_23545 [Mucilaginibacter sp. AW1-3]